MSESKRRVRYNKLEAVRLVKGGQVAAVTAKILGIPKQTLENWVRLHGKGQLKGVGDKPVNPVRQEVRDPQAGDGEVRPTGVGSLPPVQYLQ